MVVISVSGGVRFLDGLKNPASASLLWLVTIMYLDRSVELRPATGVLANPARPYSAALLNASPSVKRCEGDFEPLKGDLPFPPIRALNVICIIQSHDDRLVAQSKNRHKRSSIY